MQNALQKNRIYHPPFGMAMDGRSWTAESEAGYRFGFNGQENDNEVKGDGNSVAFENRIYDSRLGRWLSTDPREKEYAWQSTYAYYKNSPITIIDLLGGGGPYEKERGSEYNASDAGQSDKLNKSSSSSSSKGSWKQSDIARLSNNALTGLTDPNRSCDMCCLNALASNLDALYGEQGAADYPTNGNVRNAIEPLQDMGLASGPVTRSPLYKGKRLTSRNPEGLIQGADRKKINPNIINALNKSTGENSIGIFAVGIAAQYHSTLIVVIKDANVSFTGVSGKTFTGSNEKPLYLFIEDYGGSRAATRNALNNNIRDFITGARKYYRNSSTDNMAMESYIWQLYSPD